MSLETTYAIMYLEINVMAILLVGIILYKTQGISKMVAQRNFSMSIHAEIVFFLTDTIHVMIMQGILPFNSVLVIFTKSMYFFATTLMCYFWFVYFEYMQDSPFVESRKRIRISSTLVWVMALLLIINAPTGILFYVDDAGSYNRGPLFVIQYVLAYAYVMITCFRAFIGIFDKKRLAQRRTLIMLALFPVAPAGAGILQFIYPHLPLACMTLSLATLIMYMDYVDKMISVDALTKLNNRKQLAYHYEHWMQSPDEDDVYLLMIDANKFKSINDTYGHIEGDAALVRIADAMRLGCREMHLKNNIARYGGDEFVILLWTGDEAVVEKLKSSINTHLARLNEEANSPYELTVCIGSAKASKTTELQRIIEVADEQLYDAKRSR